MPEPSMNYAFRSLVNPGDVTGSIQAHNHLKEAVQEATLWSLNRQRFFDYAVFHGGTCLRIIYGLDRFSEDLDFSLRAPNMDFDLVPFTDGIVKDFETLGMTVSVKCRPPKGEMPIFSAVIKTNLRDALWAAGFHESVIEKTHSKIDLKIKIDVDMDPPEYSSEILVHKSGPLEYDALTESLPVLFAGKTAAVLCRQWKNRVKGRDFYDFRWYVEHNIPLDLECLRTRLNKKCLPEQTMDQKKLMDMLDSRFDSIDFGTAADDVRPFLNDANQLGEWNAENFKILARRIVLIER